MVNLTYFMDASSTDVEEGRVWLGNCRLVDVICVLSRGFCPSRASIFEH